MKPSKVVIIVGCVVLICVLLICGLMYTTDQNEADDLLARYNKNTQHFDRTEVTTIIEEIRRDKNKDLEDFNYTPIDTSAVTSWLEACELAHHVMWHAGMTYSTTASGTINGMFVQSDCAGYLGVAMYLYGLQGDMSAVTPVSLKNNSNLDYLGQISLSEYEPGDILVYPNHTEVYVKQINQNGYNVGVYSWGNSTTAEGLYQTDNSGHNASDCTVNILTGSGAYKGNNSPDVYRLKSGVTVSPPAPPAPQPTTDPNAPGIPTIPTPQPSTPGTKMLNLPRTVLQGQYSSITLGTSNATVSSVGCFASSMQMIANYLVSPNSAWSEDQVKRNFKLDCFTSGGSAYGPKYMQALTNGKYSITGDTTVHDITQVTTSIDQGRPVVLHFSGQHPPYYASSSNTHFVVVEGYDDTNLYIADPANKLTAIPKDYCTKASNLSFRFIQ
ncbi:MAG: C39 family peptidase [Lachnospiraceae bacterium]|nr:C39 family peptidase [Lachnospiraceae bacterium]MCM1233822.1 C39 family peptidase [Ruminococcus flavefaciens]